MVETPAFRRKDFSWVAPFLIGFARVCGSIAKKYSALSSPWSAHKVSGRQSSWSTNMNTGTVLRSLLVMGRRPGSSPSRFRLGWSASMYQFQYRWPFTLLADGSDHCLAIITFTDRRVSVSIPDSRRLRVVGRKSWHPLHNS